MAEAILLILFSIGMGVFLFLCVAKGQGWL